MGRQVRRVGAVESSDCTEIDGSGALWQAFFEGALYGVDIRLSIEDSINPSGRFHSSVQI